MTPIEKNILVVDEQGNEYEATYPRRAKGLVKNGRARFLSEDKICLACPPNKNLEDNIMTDSIDISYVFKQLEEIQKQTGYLSEAINALSSIVDDSGEACSPGNIAGQEKAKTLGDVVRCRETTNQRLIEFYEMVYRDLRNLSVPPVTEASSSPKQTVDNTLNDLVSASKAFAEVVSHNVVVNTNDQ